MAAAVTPAGVTMAAEAAAVTMTAAAEATVTASAVALCRRGKRRNSLSAVLPTDRAAGTAAASVVLVSSAFATSDKRIYQLLLIFGLAGIALMLLGQLLLSLPFFLIVYSFLTHSSLICSCIYLLALLSFSSRHLLEPHAPRGKVEAPPSCSALAMSKTESCSAYGARRAPSVSPVSP